jgi:proteasome lid subunit RPN8/RPN11
VLRAAPRQRHHGRRNHTNAERDHIEARREARGRNLEVVGFYHSHPHSPPEPSATDVTEASYPDHLYLIVSPVTDPAEIRLFRLVAGKFLEVPFLAVR